jgi:signal transduction histidine kinase
MQMVRLRESRQAAKHEALRSTQGWTIESNAIAPPSARGTSMNETVAAITHEVNQPLAAILANAECCLGRLDADPPDIEGARKAMERIIRNGQHASAVLGTIRDLLKVPIPMMSELDLKELISDALDLIHIDLTGNDVVMQIQLCRNIGCIRGNRIQLQQVLVNLIKNAIQSMSAAVKHKRILRVTTTRDGGSAVVAVEDCGVGFGAETAARMFDPFFTTKNDGTGLGLSICRSIVESHGGILWATHREPEGSIFRFTLPIVGHEATMKR